MPKGRYKTKSKVKKGRSKKKKNGSKKTKAGSWGMTGLGVRK